MSTINRKSYPSDLTDEQWELIEELIPNPCEGGRPRKIDMREVVNAILYLSRSGCQWDMLPHDFPSKSCWRDDGTWQSIVDVLRGTIRQMEARSEEMHPSAGSIDSQTIKMERTIGRAWLRRRQENHGAQTTSFAAAASSTDAAVTTTASNKPRVSTAI